MNCIMNLFEEISSPILNNVMVIRTPLEGIYQASPELREDEKIFFFQTIYWVLKETYHWGPVIIHSNHFIPID